MSANTNARQLDAHLGGLVAQYSQRGVLVDTNILLLFFIGSYDIAWIKKFKPTDKFDARDFQIVVGFLAAFAHWVTTPHVLTEVSGWCEKLPSKNRYQCLLVFRTLVARFFEVHAPATDATLLAEFPRFGLVDMSIEHVAKDQYLVLTNDAPLAGHLAGAGVDAINFADIR